MRQIEGLHRACLFANAFLPTINLIYSEKTVLRLNLVKYDK